MGNEMTDANGTPARASDHVRRATRVLVAEGSALIGLGLLTVVGGLLPRGLSPIDFPGFEGSLVANLLFFGTIGLVLAGFGALVRVAGLRARRGRGWARVGAIALALLPAIVGASILVGPSSGALFPAIGGAVALANAYVVMVLATEREAAA